ncbi:hypothetical protein LXL04_020639 [Taraxacum kok-saghyz]
MERKEWCRTIACKGCDGLAWERRRDIAQRDRACRGSIQVKLMSIRSRSFENSYIPENPRTLKPLTFSKNRLRGAKNWSNRSSVAKKISEKTIFFSKTLHMCKKFFLHMCTFFCFVSKTLKYLKKLNFFIGLFFRKTFFAAGLVFERFLTSRSRFESSRVVTLGLEACPGVLIECQLDLRTAIEVLNMVECPGGHIVLPERHCNRQNNVNMKV